MLFTPPIEANPAGARQAIGDQLSHAAGLGAGSTATKGTWQGLAAAMG